MAEIDVTRSIQYLPPQETENEDAEAEGDKLARELRELASECEVYEHASWAAVEARIRAWADSAIGALVQVPGLDQLQFGEYRGAATALRRVLALPQEIADERANVARRLDEIAEQQGKETP